MPGEYAEKFRVPVTTASRSAQDSSSRDCAVVIASALRQGLARRTVQPVPEKSPGSKTVISVQTLR
jgi:hypothetical protein